MAEPRRDGCLLQAMDDIGATVDKCCVRLRLCLHELYRLEETLRSVYISGISGSVLASVSAKQLSTTLGRYAALLCFLQSSCRRRLISMRSGT